MRKAKVAISALLFLALVLSLVGGIEIWGYSGNDGEWTAPLGKALAPGDTISVGTNTPFTPFEFRDGEGNLVGFTIDLVEEIGARAGKTITWTDYATWEALLEAGKTGEVDMIASSMTITAAREEVYDFSTSYYSANLAVLAHTSSTRTCPGKTCTANELSGLTWVVQTGTTSNAWVRDNLGQDCATGGPLFCFADVPTVIETVKTGGAEVAIMDLPAAVTFANVPANNLVAIGKIVTNDLYGMAVQEGDPLGILPLINPIIQQLRDDGFITQLEQDWGVPSDVPPLTASLRIIGPWFGSARDAFLAVLDAFEVETGILTDYIPIRARDLRLILDQKFALGETPADVIFMGPEYIRQASRDGHVVHVNNMIDEADFIPGALDPVMVGNTMYGGAYTDAYIKAGFWYKDSLFTARGWNKNPADYNAFTALLADIQADGMTPLVTGNGLGWPLSDMAEHFIATYGGAQMHRDLTAGTMGWTDPAVRTVFSDFLVPLITAGYFDAPVAFDAGLADLWAERNAMYFQGSFILGFSQIEDPSDMRVMALPGGVANQGIVFFPDTFFIPAYTDVLGEAKLLFQFLASAEGQAIQVQQGGHVATALGVPLDDYPAGWARGAAADMAGKEVLSDLDDVIGGTFQTTFWSQLQLLWALPTQLDAVLAVLQAEAPTPSSNTPPAASFAVSPSMGDVTTTFTLDASPSSDAEDTKGALKVRWDWKDDGVWDTPWSTTKTAQHQYTEPGTYTIRLEVEDTQGLTDTTTRQVVTVVDNTPPLTTAVQSGTAGQAGWFVSWVVVTLLAVDDLSGVASTSFRIDGGASQAYTSPFTVGDGIHTVEYFSTDNAGNTESVNSFDVRVDAVPPETSFSFDGTLGENGWYISTVIVTLIAADATSGVSTINYRIDGGALQTYIDPFTVGEGEHTLEYQAADAAGNEETANSAPLKVDTSKPTVTIDTPADGSILDSASVSVSGTASDGFFVDRVELSTDGTNWVRATETTSWSGTLTLLEGPNTIFARATDKAGNTATVTITVTVETEPETPPLGFQLSPSTVTFAGIGVVAAVAAVAALLFWRRRAGRKRKE